MQVIEHRGNEFVAAALRVKIFISHDQSSASLRSALRGDPECARMAEMKKTGRRGCQASAIRFSLGWGHAQCSQANANRNGDAIDSDSAYSIWSTRRDTSVLDFDEACTTNGRMAMTPPLGATQSTASIRFESS